jgi:hypothetical protein
VWRPLIAPVVTCREWGAVTTFIPLPAGFPLDTVGWEQTPLVVRQAAIQLLAVIHEQEARIAALEAWLSQHSTFMQWYMPSSGAKYMGRTDLCEPGLSTYVERATERMYDAIEPDDDQGEPPLFPILNRCKPINPTTEVDFKTTRPCYTAIKSHINQVVLDTST